MICDDQIRRRRVCQLQEPRSSQRIMGEYNSHGHPRGQWQLQRTAVVWMCLMTCCAEAAWSSTTLSGPVLCRRRTRTSKHRSLPFPPLSPSSQLNTMLGATNLLVMDDIELWNATEPSIATMGLAALNDTLGQGGERHLTDDQQSPTMRSSWRRRHARSISEGIRHEKTFESMLKKAHLESFHANRHYFARTIAGLLSAVAEESQGLVVQVNSQKDSPLWEKRIDSIEINFSRLAFQPLRLGGLHNVANAPEPAGATLTTTPMASSNAQNQESQQQSKEKVVSKDFEMASVRSMNEAFERIDVDNSGTLDRDEIAKALDIATESDSDEKLLTALASELVELYDTNGDGVVDFEEYQYMVNDMAALRQVQIERKQESDQSKEKQSGWGRWLNFGRGPVSSSKSDNSKETALTSTPATYVNGDLQEKEPVVKGTGTITLTDLKLDLRQLLFGFVPFVKKITPGGPLVLEPFRCTVHGSFNKEDVMESHLVDMGLRRLVARALRRRMGSVRDIMDGALFYGRSWNMASGTAPVIEVPRLTQVEFDSEDRLIITGRAIVKTSPDAPLIENAFKVRTKIGTRKDGHVIRLEQPELALVLECPQSWERNIESVCKKLNWPIPKKPDPIYSFFPIYSPFKVEDNDGFDLGPDNRVKSLYISDGALRFEMESILRPGRFLGSYYIAFTVPIRTFLVTMDRVVSGIRAARKNKRELQKNAAEGSTVGNVNGGTTTYSTQDVLQNNGKDGLLKFADVPTNGRASSLTGRTSESATNPSSSSSKKPNKNFFSRFVEGYLGVGNYYDEVRNERLTLAISEWFGRQGNGTESLSSNVDIKKADPEKESKEL